MIDLVIVHGSPTVFFKTGWVPHARARVGRSADKIRTEIEMRSPFSYNLRYDSATFEKFIVESGSLQQRTHLLRTKPMNTTSTRQVSPPTDGHSL